MRRLTSNFISVLSLLLSATVVAVWIHSFFAHDWARCGNEDFGYFYNLRLYKKTGYELHSVNGRLTLIRFRDALEAQPGFSRRGFIWQKGESTWFVRSDERRQPRGGGMGGAGTQFTTTEKVIFSFSELWFIVAVLGLTVVWEVRRRRRARTKSGFCPTCGYDLRASSERCSECGTPIIEAEGANAEA
jgi:hypothetical protein